MNVPQFRMKVRITYSLSTIEKSYISKTEGLPLIKQSSITNYLISFEDVEI